LKNRFRAINSILPMKSLYVEPRGVIALREIDFRTIGTGKAGPITRALQQAFDSYQRRSRALRRVAFVRAGFRCGCSKGLNGGIMKRHKHHQETEAVREALIYTRRMVRFRPPIYQTSTFEVTDSEQQLRATHTDMFYTRYGNPTTPSRENAIAELEGADGALLFASGMTAITTTVLALLKSGDPHCRAA